MPRDGSGQYHAPPGTDGAPETTIDSAKYNYFVADLEQVLNLPAPIISGGTGASTPDGALVNLSAEKASQIVTNYDSMAWMSGSFSSAAGATNPPVAGHAFSGIAYVIDANNATIEARDQDGTLRPGALYVRQKKAGVWSPWGTGSVAGPPSVANPLPVGVVAAPGSAVPYAREDHVHTLSLTPIAAGANLNTITAMGFYYTSDANALNTPTPGVAHYWYVEVFMVAPTYVEQIATLYETQPPARYIRTMVAGVWGAWRQLDGRTTLTAPTTFYVRPDGNDNNSGLANSTTGAFQTIQKAVDYVSSLDLSTYLATIQVTGPTPPTTYNITTINLKNYLGPPPLIIGDTANPLNVVISAANGDCFLSDAVRPWHIRGFRIKSTVGGHCLHAVNGGIIYFQNIDFNGSGPGYAHMNASYFGAINATATYTISGGGEFHLLSSNANITIVSAGTIVVSNTPAFATAFAYATNVGFIYTSGANFSGAATGMRYTMITNAAIYTGGGGANYFPGSIAGPTSPTPSGGQYG
jgi:hypothetical protein